jgi:hypothetical protein
VLNLVVHVVTTGLYVGNLRKGSNARWKFSDRFYNLLPADPFMLQGTGTAGGNFNRRPWLKMGCCANDDGGGGGGDDDDDD